MKWTSFKNQQPSLGMSIDIRYFDDEKGLFHEPTFKWVEKLNMGKIKTIQDLEGGWLSFNTNNYVGLAVRSNYEWRISL